MKDTQLLLALDNGSLREGIESAIGENTDFKSVTHHNPKDWSGVLSRLNAERPQLLVLELAPVLARLGDALREVKSYAPDTKVITVHPSADSNTILAAMRAGANEFVHPPWADHLPSALQRMANASSLDDDPNRKGKIIAFLSAKGGCGATTLACHIAVDLQRQTNKKVLLADLDFVSGMIGFLMKTETSYSILDAVQNLSRLDESLWKALVGEPKRGLSIMPAPRSFAEYQTPSRDDLRALLRFMRTQNDWTILDLGRSLNTVAANIYDEIDQILLVSVMEVTALHGLKSIVRRLSESGESLDRVQLVMNRVPKMMDMTSDELAKILGRPLYASLPNDYPSLYQSYSSGNLLPENNLLAQQFGVLTSKLAGRPVAKPKKKFSLFA